MRSRRLLLPRKIYIIEGSINTDKINNKLTKSSNLSIISASRFLLKGLVLHTSSFLTEHLHVQTPRSCVRAGGRLCGDAAKVGLSQMISEAQTHTITPALHIKFVSMITKTNYVFSSYNLSCTVSPVFL